MDFKKYQHVERFGTEEVYGIDNGMCYIFPKIDGTNAQLWWHKCEDGLSIICAGSRNRELSIDNDNQGFFNWVMYGQNAVKFTKFFVKNPNIRLYGEWLVPHTLRTYKENAWKNFYVFDVMLNEKYLPYEEYKEMLEEFNIDYIPPICKIKNPTYERLVNQLEKNSYLIKDGSGVGEGIVIKNYDYKNKYGRITWAKIVRNDFKTQHQKCDVTEIKESKIVEEEIVKKYITEALVEKEFSKIKNEYGWSSKRIPQLLNTVFYCLIKEETWNFLKENRLPTINFKTLNMFVIQKIKEIKPDIF